MKEGREYKRERRPWGRGIRELREKNIVEIKIGLVTKLKKNIYKNSAPQIVPMTFFLDKTSLSLLSGHLDSL